MCLKSEWSHFVFLSNLHVNSDLDRGLKRRVGAAGNCLHRMDREILEIPPVPVTGYRDYRVISIGKIIETIRKKKFF